MQHEYLSQKIDRRPLFEMLKQGTTDLHRKMQILSPVLHHHVTLSQYKDFLLRQLGFYIPIEEQVFEFLSLGRDPFDMENRKKVPLLIADLNALGVSFQEIHDIPICGAIKEIGSMAELVGVLFVIEELTLDSQIVYKKLKDQLPLADNQLQFYKGYGRDTYEMWYKFRAISEALLSEEDKEEAVTRARITFIKFKNWLKMNEVQA
jgi:heme oxygenase (biliverdin-IX-beta and delta-forming)